MSDDFVHWPAALLRPGAMLASPVYFSRSGGRSLGGIERTARTDRGYWSISLQDITIWHPSMRRIWNSIRTTLGGRAGLIVVPVWSFDSAPYLSGDREGPIYTSHDDDSLFDDDTQYVQGSITIETAAEAALGATEITIRLVNAADSPAGIRFSYQYALYETGAVLNVIDANTYTVSVFPAVRRAIPAGSTLECDLPTCLTHLADDTGMDIGLNPATINSATVNFVEAVDYWNDLALEEA